MCLKLANVCSERSSLWRIAAFCSTGQFLVVFHSFSFLDKLKGLWVFLLDFLSCSQKSFKGMLEDFGIFIIVANFEYCKK